MAWTKEAREAWTHTNPHRKRELYERNKEDIKRRARANYQKNKERHRINQKRWNEKNKESLKAYQRQWHQERRLRCIEHLGGKCVCCGESNQVFLAIDHINNDGSKHRKAISRKMIYGWLIKNNFPPGFQLLCHNCNMAKSILGKCPHAI